MNSLVQFCIAIFCLLLFSACGDDPNSSYENDTSTPVFSAEGLTEHIIALSSDAFEGRAPMTPGGEKTRQYIAQEYERLGIKSIGDSYFHRVPLVETTLDPETSFFRIDTGAETTELEYKKDVVYWTKRVEESLSFTGSDMVFVGYGIVAPEYSWDDYKDVDVVGKTVVILVNDPGFATQDPELFNGNAMT